MLECICMRTTVQLRDDQREQLAALAARRGMRGYSMLIQEALDRYLSDADNDREAKIARMLALRGSISDEQAAQMRERIAESRTRWRTSS